MSKLYHYSESGLDNVWLASGVIHHKTPYGPGVSVEAACELLALLAMHLVDKPSRLTGKEFRYLRVSLKLSQAEVARAHGVGEQVISLWERHGKVPKANDFLLRLRYLAQAGDVDKLPEILARMDEPAPPVRQRIVARKTTRGWRLTVELAQTAPREAARAAA